jgi:hypothetical protein
MLLAILASSVLPFLLAHVSLCELGIVILQQPYLHLHYIATCRPVASQRQRNKQLDNDRY